MTAHQFFKALSSFSIKTTLLLCALAAGIVMVDIVRLSLSQISVAAYSAVAIGLVVSAISTALRLMTDLEAK